MESRLGEVAGSVSTSAAPRVPDDLRALSNALTQLLATYTAPGAGGEAQLPKSIAAQVHSALRGAISEVETASAAAAASVAGCTLARERMTDADWAMLPLPVSAAPQTSLMLAVSACVSQIVSAKAVPVCLRPGWVEAQPRTGGDIQSFAPAMYRIEQALEGAHAGKQLVLTGVVAGDDLIVHAHVHTPASAATAGTTATPAQAPAAELSLRVADWTRFVPEADAAGLDAPARVCACVWPLWDADASERLRTRLEASLVKPLGLAQAQKARSAAAAAVPSRAGPSARPPEDGRSPVRGPTWPTPGMPSVGGGDVMPDFRGAVPGGFGQPFPGSLVGPDHPLFRGPGGGMPGGFPGGLPPGVPPGARFDPFGPPSTMPRQPGFGGRGGPPAPRGFGPNPDHLRPPHDDDMPDIYW